MKQIKKIFGKFIEMKFGYKRGIYLQPIIKIVIKFVKILGMDNNIILTLRLVQFQQQIIQIVPERAMIRQKSGSPQRPPSKQNLQKNTSLLIDELQSVLPTVHDGRKKQAVQVAKWFIENRNHCHHSQAWPYRHHNEAKMNNKKSRSANKSKKKKGHQKKKNVINQSIGGTQFQAQMKGNKLQTQPNKDFSRQNSYERQRKEVKYESRPRYKFSQQDIQEEQVQNQKVTQQTLMIQNLQLNAMLKMRNQDLSKADEKITQLQKNYQRTSINQEITREQLNQQEDRNRRLETQINMANDQIVQLERQSNGRRQQLEEANEQIALSRQRIVQLERQSNGRRQQLEEANEQIALSREQIALSRQRIGHLQRQKHTLTDQLRQSQERSNNLFNQFNTRNQLLLEQNRLIKNQRLLILDQLRKLEASNAQQAGILREIYRL